jgi:hypothetical protein
MYTDVHVKPTLLQNPALVYTNATPDGLQSITLSEHSTEDLGKLFQRIARSDEMRSLVEKVIDQLAGQNAPSWKE